MQNIFGMLLSLLKVRCPLFVQHDDLEANTYQA